MDRRTVLGLMAAATTGLGASGAQGQPATPVIEWNAHMFSRDVARFPFSPRGHFWPAPLSSTNSTGFRAANGWVLKPQMLS